MVDQVFFGDGSAHLGKADRARLVALAQGAQKNGATGRPAVLTVVGFASARVRHGKHGEQINDAIAAKRAEAVASVLIGAGLGADTVKTIAKGVDGHNPNPGKRSQEAADRRVEVYMNNM
jgi:outer membrane protein OmpA-like peptidoglycan-associated protein